MRYNLILDLIEINRCLGTLVHELGGGCEYHLLCAVCTEYCTGYHIVHEPSWYLVLSLKVIRVVCIVLKVCVSV